MDSLRRRRFRIGYLGPPGTFSEEAARARDSAAEHVPFGELGAVARAADEGAVDEAVVPVENSVEGPVTAVVDLLIHRSALAMRREIVVPVRHCLLVDDADVRLDRVRIVYSHPQALAQCRRFLERRLPEARTMASLSTVRAVRDMRKAGPEAAAISSARAAEVTGARIAARGVEDAPNNRTRFVALGRRDAAPTGRDKTSLCFGFARDGAGLLHEALGEFAARGINLFKIESRPAGSALGRYVFLIDLDGHRTDPPVTEALEAIRARSASFKILGSYPQAKAPASTG